MVILGLQFGHDASVAILKDGELLLCYERERTNRIKHTLGLNIEDIELCLRDAGLSLDQVDFVTLTSTQLIEYIQTDKTQMSLSLERLPGHRYPCTLTDKLATTPEQMETYSSGWLKYIADSRPDHPIHKLHENLKQYANEEQMWGSFEHFVNIPLWQKVVGLDEMAATDYSTVMGDDVSQGFHYPATITLKGRKIPAYVFAHHFAHAAYSYYSSPYNQAAIISHDGGGGGYGYGSGLFFYALGNRLYPITPHNLFVGEIYDVSGLKLNFHSGPPGKLMGLSAYGKPRFYDPKFVGNWHDLKQMPADSFFNHCLQSAEKMGYDLKPLGKKDQMLAPINIDIAASVQKLAEEIMLKSVFVLDKICHNSGVGAVSNLCLTGGVALNCPANTRIWKESTFSNIHLPPAVGDMGLSIGSAYALYYNIMQNNFVPTQTSPKLAYQGLRGSSSKDLIEKAVEAYSDRLKVTRLDLSFKMAAKDLSDNKVIGWFEGESEVGPRSLGHRSILSNPTHAENWPRVNRIKGREIWRPFAPSVLAEKADQFFYGTQMPSYFMLLNAQVRVNNLPAITHADGSARIQSVSSECGNYYHLLKELDELTGIPVVMNTSFNGPGEPIVETPEHAIEFLLRTDMDALYLGDFRLEKRGL